LCFFFDVEPNDLWQAFPVPCLTSLVSLFFFLVDSSVMLSFAAFCTPSRHRSNNPVAIPPRCSVPFPAVNLRPLLFTVLLLSRFVSFLLCLRFLGRKASPPSLNYFFPLARAHLRGSSPGVLSLINLPFPLCSPKRPAPGTVIWLDFSI